MKKFDLEAAKAGAKVVTRDGRSVRIVCFDVKDMWPIVALITETDGQEIIRGNLKNGNIFESGNEHPCDLFMAPVKKEGWMNCYPDFRNTVYATKAEADKEAVFNRISCVKVEWEQ